MTRMRDVTTCT